MWFYPNYVIVSCSRLFSSSKTSVNVFNYRWQIIDSINDIMGSSISKDIIRSCKSSFIVFFTQSSYLFFIQGYIISLNERNKRPISTYLLIVACFHDLLIGYSSCANIYWHKFKWQRLLIGVNDTKKGVQYCNYSNIH